MDNEKPNTIRNNNQCLLQIWYLTACVHRKTIKISELKLYLTHIKPYAVPINL